MKLRRWHFSVLFIVLSSCHYNDKKLTEQYITRLNKEVEPVKQVIVQDRNRYAPLFVDSLRRSQYPGSMKLENNYMIVGADTTRFPADLNEGNLYRFSAHQGLVDYELQITRINLTDIEFNCIISQNHKEVYRQRGTATLSPMFFLAAEAPEDDISKEIYGAYPYRYYAQGHDLEILVGIGRDEHDLLRATLSGDDLKQFGQNIPVLRAK
ncbi:hypothetical protein GCM10027037_08080 [Mucilaginibacter koreensis]